MRFLHGRYALAWLAVCALFFIELGSRRVHLAGCTASPSGDWVAQQARNLCWSLQERRTPLRFLIHDRDSKFTRAFDEIFRTEGLESIRTPFQAPKANAVAERFVRTVRAECLDLLLIAGSRQLERTLRTSALDSEKHLRRRDRLGGLIHEYSWPHGTPASALPSDTRVILEPEQAGGQTRSAER